MGRPIERIKRVFPGGSDRRAWLHEGQAGNLMTMDCDTVGLDSRSQSPYLRRMVQLARLVVALLIAIVAMWSVVQPTGATTMSLAMASAAPGGGMDMLGCDDCGPDRTDLTGHVLCQSVCATVVLADLGIPQALRSIPTIATQVATPVHVLVGQTYPPEPHPPRALPLI